MEIHNCPSTLADGFTTYSPKATKTLFLGKNVSPYLDFEIEELYGETFIDDTTHRISVSGVQEKFPAIVENGKIRIAGVAERSTHILKPAPWDNTLIARRQIPANEHLTMLIANQVYGISTASCGLCFTQKGHIVYITRRFDILPDGTKLPMEDFATLLQRMEHPNGEIFKYQGCYGDIAHAIRRNVAAWKVEMERFFELVLFNYIYGNGDAHLKNFSLIYNGQDYRLAPAYDLINTSLHLHGDDFALDRGLSDEIEKSDVFLRTGHACMLDFERFGEYIGISDRRLHRILERYTQIPLATSTLIEHSFLDDKMKRSYKRIITERMQRFIRVSE